jgi:hypothetical protein
VGRPARRAPSNPTVGFTDAWVVVLAVPAFITLFARIHRYYQRPGQLLGLGNISGKPRVKPAVVVVPANGVSRLAEHAVSEALSISAHVIAVTVLTDDDSPDTSRDRELHKQWNRWNPGPPLEVLHTEYASVAGHILAFLLKGRKTGPVFVTGRKARVQLPAADLDPSGQARLSCPQAAALFSAASGGGRCTSCNIRCSLTTQRTGPGRPC